MERRSSECLSWGSALSPGRRAGPKWRGPLRYRIQSYERLVSRVRQRQLFKVPAMPVTAFAVPAIDGMKHLEDFTRNIKIR